MRQASELLDSEHAAQSDDAPPDEEPQEPQETEALGESDPWVGEAPPEFPEEEWPGPLPSVSDLRRPLRPPVLFRITADFSVRKLYRSNRAHSEARYAIALTIAEHLRRTEATLSKRGDWCHVPAIGTYEQLKAGCDVVQRVADDVFPDIRLFAIVLPNGDVVSADALVEPARAGKRATRAAALRLASQRPETLAGESWTSKDWDSFEDSQRKARWRSAASAQRRQNRDKRGDIPSVG